MPPLAIIPSRHNKLSPSYDTSVSLHRSSQIRTSSFRLDSNDGLLPGCCLVDTISDSSLSANHLHCLHTAKQTSPLDNQALALLSEYFPFVDSHCLVPLDLSGIAPIPLNRMLLAIADSFLEPHADIDDDPLWVEAMASPKYKFWIAST